MEVCYGCMRYEKQMKTLQTQLKEAEKVIDLLYTKEESTTLKSKCWIKAMEYKTKYKD